MNGERERQEGWWGALQMEGFAISAHILWACGAIATDIRGCLSPNGIGDITKYS